MQDQPVVSVAAEGLRDDFFEFGLDLVDRISGREAGSVAYAEDVGVDRECFFAERGVQNDVRGLAADSGKLLQLLTSSRHLASVIIDQRLAERDDILRFSVEKADGLDRLAKRFLAEIDHLFRGFDVSEQRFGRDIHARVGGLRREHDGYQQLVGIGRFQFGRRRWIGLRQAAEEFENLVAGHRLSITSRIE